jgi:hypothetical protein
MTADDLRAELEATRRAIQRDYAGLRGELDVVAKAKRSIVENPMPWLGGSALVGWVLSGRKRRKARKLERGAVARKAGGITALGLLFSAARFAFPLVQPLVQPYLARIAAEKLGQFAKSRR